MKYLELATRIALANTQAKTYLFGVVAERKDRLIVTSTNLRTQSPCKAAHAEKRVLSKAGYGAIIYVVRVDRLGKWCMAKPCNACETFARNKCVKKIFYSIADKEYGCLSF